MAFYEVNMDEYDAWDGEQTSVDAGDYEVTITELKSETSSKKGIPLLAVTFTVERAADGSDSAFAGRKIFNRYPLPPSRGAGRLKNLLAATGVRYTTRGFDDEELMGKVLLVTVTKEPYQDFDESKNETVTKTGTRVSKERSASAAGNGATAAPPHTYTAPKAGRPRSQTATR